MPSLKNHLSGNPARIALIALAGLPVFALAQPYSGALGDAENAFDAPIPGFVGPGGEGKVSVNGRGTPLSDLNGVNPVFLGWATGVTEYRFVEGLHSTGDPVVAQEWQTETNALGPVTGNYLDIVSLGDLDAQRIQDGVEPGQLTVTFARQLKNVTGADLAIFENAPITASNQGGAGVGGIFAELAYVEVSSDGVNFARFPSISETPDLVGAYGSIDPTQVYNLAGKHENHLGDSWGTPFDFSDLEDHPLVVGGTVDLDAITHVRLIDVPGSGTFLDSRGNPIYDAWPTFGSGGADIEAIGVIGVDQHYDDWDAGRNLDPAANDDGDPWSNLAEYAFRLDPTSPDGFAIPAIGGNEQGEITISFPRDERNISVRYHIYYNREGLRASGWRSGAQIVPNEAPTLDPSVFSDLEFTRDSDRASVGVYQQVRLTAVPAAQIFFRIEVEPIP